MSVRFLAVLALTTFGSFSIAFATPKTPSKGHIATSHHAAEMFRPTDDIQKNSFSANTQLLAASEPNDEVVYIDRDFRLSSIFLFGAFVFAQIPIIKFILAPLAGLLGVLFLVQTFRLKFVCDSEAFQLFNTSQESGENILVGGENRWTYDSFVNYDFFPKGWIDQPQGPILVYFKETQTPQDKWKEGPGASANSDEALKDGAVPGQVHFFPALCNTKQLRAVWEKNDCGKL